MYLFKIFQILFIVGSTFPFFIPECLNNYWWCSRHLSQHVKTKEELLLNSYPVILMKILMEFLVHHYSFFFFSGGTKSSFVDHILFPRFKYLFLPVHLFIIHLSLFICSGVLKISRRFVFPLLIRSSYFEDVISFKPFNSTGAISL